MFFQRRQDAGSSSDETRSSGHASMSDTLSSSPGVTERHQHFRSPLNVVPEDEKLTANIATGSGENAAQQSQLNKARGKNQQSRSRHRATPAKVRTSAFLPSYAPARKRLFPSVCRCSWLLPVPVSKTSSWRSSS